MRDVAVMLADGGDCLCDLPTSRAAGNFNGDFGFQPLLCYLDHSDEALAGLLRPRNADANTAADQIAVADEALAQIPTEEVGELEILL